MPLPRFHGFTIHKLASPLSVTMGESRETRHTATIPLLSLEEVPDQVRQFIQEVICLW